jgi:hypothetical protein
MKVRGSRVSAGRGYLGNGGGRGGDVLRWLLGMRVWWRGGGGTAVWAAPVHGPADEVLGRGRGPGSRQKATTDPVMARAWGRECFPMNTIQSARVWRVRFGPLQAAAIRWPVAVQPGQPWYLDQYLRGHSKPR